LRAVAVLLVVGCHCGISWCAGGFIGVDVFFVISGYLITGILATEYREHSRIDLARFFARRARRLLPACALVLVVTALTAVVVLTPQEIEATAHAAMAASLYVSNIFFGLAAVDYFAPAVERNPLLHTWSLGIEEQFYLVWPCLMWFAYRGGTRRSMWFLGVLAASSLACALYATRLAPMFAFYELPARAWEFAAGGLLALAPLPKTSARGTRWGACSGVLGVVMILGTAVWVKGGAGFPGWIALFPVGGTLAILFAGAMAPRVGVSAALGVGPLQFIGARSYSWYLWHWPFLVFAAILFPGITIAQKIETAIAALLMAECTYRWVEHPTRENRYLRGRPQLSLSGAAGAASITFLIAGVSAYHGREELKLDQRFQFVAAATTDYGFARLECYADGSSFEVRMCRFGEQARARTVVLFGDSHAMQWINAMRRVTDKAGWGLITVVRPGCAASDINPHQLSVAADRCKKWRPAAIEKIIALAPALVVMASYNGATLHGDSLTSTLMPAEEIRSGTRRTLAKFLAAGIPVVVLRDSPLPPFDIPACIARSIGRRPQAADPCEFDAAVALNPEAARAERSAAEGLPKMFYLDLDDLICPGKSCPAIQHGKIIYRDDNHLAGSYAESLAPQVEDRLVRLLADGGSVLSRTGS